MDQNIRKLTKREAEVLEEILNGYTLAETGNRLGVAKKTVEAHIFRMYGKLNVHNRIGLVKRAIELGWLTYTKRGKEDQWIQHIFAYQVTPLKTYG